MLAPCRLAPCRLAPCRLAPCRLAPRGPAPRRWAAQDLGEVEADRLLQLGVGARARLAVRPPPDELRGVPESQALHVVVADLDHALRAQRDERQVLVRVPPAEHGRPWRPLGGLLL